MRAGRLNRRLTLQRLSEQRQANGEAKTVFTDDVTVWGSVEPLRGEELLTAQKVSAKITVRLVIRYRPGISSKWRVKMGDRIFRIEGIVNPQDGKRELQLMGYELPDGEEI